jgi:UrcA family protein
MLRTIMFAIASACALAAFSAPASASTFEDSYVSHERVSYADLDLSTQKGADRLLHRIRTAAKHVCRGPGVMPATMSREVRKCMTDATDAAVASLNNDIVLALYFERTGRNPAGPAIASISGS